MYLLLNTVWKELEKENKEFFEAYARKNAERATVMETRERIEKMLANSTTIRDTKQATNKKGNININLI